MSFHRACIVQSLEKRILFATLPAGFTESIQGGSITNGTNMTYAPDGRLFVTQQGGQVRVVDHGVLQPTPFVSISTTSSGERGLLGIAFDPDYFNNHYVYVYYTVPTAPIHNRVSRFTADPNNQNIVLAGSETVLLDLNNLSGATNHNGGSIHFGPDGKLYIAVGENAARANAQSFSNLLGKMLRMNKDGSIPTDNPYFNDPAVTGQNKLIWALGLRNPYTFAFQNGTGRMFINDVGEVSWEEINDGIPHSNYGWGTGSPTIEGFIQPGQTPPPDYRDPLLAYSHSQFPSAAIIGGAFYNPVYNSYPASYVGKYFLGDLNNSFIKYIDPGAASPTLIDFATGTSIITGMTLSPDGSVVYLQRGSTAGAYRIRFTDTTQPALSSPSFVFNENKPTFGTAQRLRVSFSEYVGDSLSPSDLTLTNLTTGVTVPTANISLQYDASTNVATFSFPGLANGNGQLPDGNYRATINAGDVSDVAGNTLAGGLSFDFFALAADANQDRHVDAADQAILTANFGQSGRTYAQGDFNYDGTVNAADQAILDAQQKLWLPPQGPLTLPATGGDDQILLVRESALLLDLINTGSFQPAFRIYSGAITGSLIFNGGNGNDSLTLNYSNGQLVAGAVAISFDGGPGSDSLDIIGASGADTFAFNGANVTGPNTINTTAVEAFSFDGLGGGDNLTVSGNASVILRNPQHLASLTVTDTSVASAAAGGNSLLVVQSLSLQGASSLDLFDNDLIVDYNGATQLAAVQSLINSARAGGTWSGRGITSTTARNANPRITTLGAMEASDYMTIAPANTTFDGEPLDGTAVLVKYTYYGDADFNGRVNFDDYTRIDAGFNAGRSGWINGDFDGNGKINFDDYTLIDAAFNGQTAVLRPARGRRR